jgi:hypothetical protein
MEYIVSGAKGKKRNFLFSLFHFLWLLPFYLTKLGTTQHRASDHNRKREKKIKEEEEEEEERNPCQQWPAFTRTTRHPFQSSTGEN